MARQVKSKAPASKPEPEVKENSVPKPETKATSTETKVKKGVRSHRAKRQALRQKLYTKAKTAQRKSVFQDAIKAAGSAEEKSALRAAAHRRPTPKNKGKDTEKTAEVEELVRKQREKARELKKQQKAKKAAKLEAAKLESAKPKKVRKPREPGSAPAKKGKGAGKKTKTAVETVVEPAAAEPMEGVEETKVVTSVEKDVDYPTLPSIEGGDADIEIRETVEEDTADNAKTDETAPAGHAANHVEDASAKQPGTPAKLLSVPRESSADSNAGTPRNLRRSPRKRTNPRSFAGY